jgi:SAM-dependent methyltransferase
MSRDPVLEAHDRRDATRDLERYAPWNPAERLMVAERTRLASAELAAVGRFPTRGRPVLEIGYGHLGWLAELVSWGLASDDLYGIELDPARAERARRALPGAHLEVGDAGTLPWADATFQLVVLSTVMSSVLDPERRRGMAAEIERVLAADGALIWYDLARDNPRNPDVRGLDRRAVRALFPQLSGVLRRVTLAPPIARMVAPRAWWLASLLQALSPLRTHLLGVLGRAL